MNGIVSTVKIFVQRGRIVLVSLVIVHRPESSASLVVISRPVVINPQRRIELLTCEQIVVGCGASGSDQVAEGILIVGICHCSGGTGEEADRTMAVKAEEESCWLLATGLLRKVHSCTWAHDSALKLIPLSVRAVWMNRPLTTTMYFLKCCLAKFRQLDCFRDFNCFRQTVPLCQDAGATA